jgi:hypothetical protein
VTRWPRAANSFAENIESDTAEITICTAARLQWSWWGAVNETRSIHDDSQPNDPVGLRRKSRCFPAQLATRDIFRNGSGFVKISLAIKGPSVGKVAATSRLTPHAREKERQMHRYRERVAWWVSRRERYDLCRCGMQYPKTLGPRSWLRRLSISRASGTSFHRGRLHFCG